ncbi:MAG TPA: class I SAM-dependent methyltransferase [Acidimicrobiales bacterium]|nr:class I SAM-dependent methyltransferase [Acidimicrobiales bacterium]
MGKAGRIDGEWTDRSYLRTVQYADPGNLVARQSIYAFQRPRIDLPAWALDLAGIRGVETVVDVGCGNGAYLAVLRRRGHDGSLIGVDLSEGMVRAVRQAAPVVEAVVGDAASLPLTAGQADVALAMHMLYHVPDPRAAVAELRRVVRDGGRVLVVLNGRDHLRQLDAMLAPAGGVTQRTAPLSGLRLDEGVALLSSAFARIERHEVRARLELDAVGPVLDYVGSMGLVQSGELSMEDLAGFVTDYVEAELGRAGAFVVDTHSGCLVCR